MSGGLDSMLAAKILAQQAKVTLVCFESYFLIARQRKKQQSN